MDDDSAIDTVSPPSDIAENRLPAPSGADDSRRNFGGEAQAAGRLSYQDCIRSRNGSIRFRILGEQQSSVSCSRAGFGGLLLRTGVLWDQTEEKFTLLRGIHGDTQL